MVYGVFGSCNGRKPDGFYPTFDSFLGEGGSFEHPRSVVEGTLASVAAGHETDGYEAMGGLVYDEQTIAPDESVTYIQALAYGNNTVQQLEADVTGFLSEECFDLSLIHI